MQCEPELETPNFAEELLSEVETSASARHEDHVSDTIFMPNSEMTEKESIRFLCRMAEDASLPLEILEKLAQHDCPEVREAVSDNPGLSIDILRNLAQDECLDVRFAIAENHNAPSNVLYELCEDDNPYVSHRARKTIERLRRSCMFGAHNLLDMERKLEIKHSRLQYSV